jgi:GGDEF domain-containing protein
MQSNPIASNLLRQALTDPGTGLPNGVYFRLICDWEVRRAQRAGGRVRVVTVLVDGGDAATRRHLVNELAREFRRSDLIACSGPGTVQMLFTSPDAEQTRRITERVSEIAETINRRDTGAPPVAARIEIEEEHDDQRLASGQPAETIERRRRTGTGGHGT